MRGHAVRALYLAAGALDVATETGDDDLSAAVREQWANGVARRTYLTGGVGSHHQDEAFGDDFELPRRPRVRGDLRRHRLGDAELAAPAGHRRGSSTPT